MKCSIPELVEQMIIKLMINILEHVFNYTTNHFARRLIRCMN